MKTEILLRSFMFMPAYNIKYIEKGLISQADAIILDLEDSVPLEKKAAARENIINYCASGAFKKKKVFVRINPLDTDDFIKDIDSVVLEDVEGFVLPKVNTAKDVEFFDRLLILIERKKGYSTKKFALAPLIETTLAVENIGEIAKASDRLIALCFGGEDYLNDLGSIYTYQASALTYPRAVIANAARANGLLPIDTPYINISDVEGFEEAERQAYKNGYAGCLVLNPKQIDAANRAFSPNEDEIEYSKKVIDAVKKSENDLNKSVVMLDGGMVGPPMRKRAETVMKQKELINRIGSK